MAVGVIVSAVPKYSQILQAVYSMIRKKSFYLWLEKYIYFILMPKRKQKASMAARTQRVHEASISHVCLRCK